MTTEPPERSGASASELAAAEAKVEALQDTVVQLEQAVESHADVDQAIGVVLALGRISPEEAWDVLRETSMRTNVKLRQVAEMVVEWGRGGELSAEVRSELGRQLRSRTDGGSPDET
ncbi:MULTISPECIES: ANTAR domain-containing protein [unclassified Streptomyces]|uniref:ANTAR domain-containing protein n=1 Tax=unclassified Streptomyces TaxID=2593676 RepID=UPI002E1879AF|nr:MULTISPECIES: ANTAR domain-containing protein [unclassified Streptomyces]